MDRLFNWSDPSIRLFLHKTAIEFDKLFNASTHHSGRSLLVCLPPSLPSILSHSSFHLASYFCAWLFNVLISILLVSYFRADPFNSPFVHSFSKIFLGRPFYSPSVHPFGELFLSRSFNSPSVHPFGHSTHFTDYFTQISAIHSYNTRGAARGDYFIVRKNTLVCGIRSICFYGAKIWNNIPP